MAEVQALEEVPAVNHALSKRPRMAPSRHRRGEPVLALPRTRIAPGQRPAAFAAAVKAGRGGDSVSTILLDEVFNSLPALSGRSRLAAVAGVGG